MPAVPTSSIHQSAFRPVIRSSPIVDPILRHDLSDDAVEKEEDTDDEVDIETTEDDHVSTAHLENMSSTATTLTNHNTRNSCSSPCWSPPRETVSI